MLKLCESFAISASASLILSSASYFWILSWTSTSFLFACWIFLRLFSYAVSCIASCCLFSSSCVFAFCSWSANLAGGLAVAGLEVRLGLRGQLADLRLAVLDLPRDALDEAAVLLEARRGPP